MGNVAGCQSGLVVWQVSQSFEMPMALWFGFTDWLKSFSWHAKQIVGVPLNPFAWQLMQSVVKWAPVNGKFELAWLKAPSADPSG